MEVQSVQVSNEISIADAKKYLREKLGLRVSKIDDSGPHFYRFRQFSPIECAPGSYATKGWTSKSTGAKVNLVMCRRRAK